MVAPGRLNIESIVSGLRLHRLGGGANAGARLELVESISSTNDLAWERAADGDADGLVIFAERQTAGRGRLGRTWESPRGASILCSVLLLEPVDGDRFAVRPDDVANGPPRGPLLSLVAGIAVCDAVFEAAGVQAELKWPNDLLAGGRKLGGILVESRLIASNSGPKQGLKTAYTIGVGINCLQHGGHFSEALREQATSLELVSVGPVERCDVARALLRHLDHWCGGEFIWTADDVRRAWLERAQPLGGHVHLEQAGRRYQGHVVDLDPMAGLVVQLAEGGRRLFDAASTTIVDD